jgi:FkbM family methyltransferase
MLNKFKIKINSLKHYYLFQRFGIPKKKEEKISKSILKRYLSNDPVVIDCGAHDGSDSVELIRILGGTVHAFEPVKEIFKRLQINTKPYNKISCYNIALSNKTGKQLFYISGGASDGSSSLLEPLSHLVDHPDTVFDRNIEVETVRLDDWAKLNNIPKVDMLWLDMQGFELQMLQASVNILNTVSVIHTEVSTKETYKDVVVYDAFKCFLEEKGFSVVLEAIPPGWDMGNVLFVKKSILL